MALEEERQSYLSVNTSGILKKPSENTVMNTGDDVCSHISASAVGMQHLEIQDIVKSSVIT